MLTTRNTRRLIDEAFEDEALVLGGLLTLHKVDDRFVHRLVRSLAVIRRRTVRAFESLGATNTESGAGHPAISAFLRDLRRP